MLEDDSGESFRRPVAPWYCGHRLWRTRSWSSGRHLKPNLLPDDYRNFSTRFQRDNLRRNLGLAERLRAVAVALHATPAKAAIAWVAAQGADIVPLIGARNRSRLGEALGPSFQS